MLFMWFEVLVSPTYSAELHNLGVCLVILLICGDWPGKISGTKKSASFSCSVNHSCWNFYFLKYFLSQFCNSFEMYTVNTGTCLQHGEQRQKRFVAAPSFMYSYHDHQATFAVVCASSASWHRALFGHQCTLLACLLACCVVHVLQVTLFVFVFFALRHRHSKAAQNSRTIKN